ncbi:MAG: zinc-finger domain-containing protein [Gammaproteobacteria bacterium]|nr:zinc-finger domain-containing protein [Gammaproteobacteria bacterium]
MSTKNAQPTKAEIIEVTREDLPLSCPRPDDEVWNMHPRVYLPIEKTGAATCPYCGARYELKS